MLTQRDEDYLICREYHDRIDLKSSEYQDFITFKHPDSNYYFAWVHDNEVILRSEAYPDEERMIRGIKAVIKNRDFPERYSVEEHHGAYHVVLWGGDVHERHTGNFESHNEIGRSCPRKSKRELYDLFLFRGRSFAEALLPLSTIPVAPSARADVTGGTSDETEGGFRWWWLLPLLLIPLFLMYRACNKDAPEVSSRTPAAPSIPKEPAPKVAVAPKEAVPATPPAAPVPEPEIPACGLNWIFFDFDKYDVRPDAKMELATMNEILTKNSGFTGVLSAFTDAKGSDVYNQRLSQNRANAAKEALVKMGIDASRIQASAFSESTPIATNTEDDSGRKFNRRVELRIKDATGREVCKSIPPAVPNDLKK